MYWQFVCIHRVCAYSEQSLKHSAFKSYIEVHAYKFQFIFDTFQPLSGGHLGFPKFDDLLDIFELCIQQIWSQHPSIAHIACVLLCHKLTLFSSSTLNMHIFWNAMKHPEWFCYCIYASFPLSWFYVVCALFFVELPFVTKGKSCKRQLYSKVAPSNEHDSYSSDSSSVFGNVHVLNLMCALLFCYWSRLCRILPH